MTSHSRCTEQKCTKMVTINLTAPFQSKNLHACLNDVNITDITGSPVNITRLDRDIREVEVDDEIDEINIEYKFNFGKRQKRLDIKKKGMHQSA